MNNNIENITEHDLYIDQGYTTIGYISRVLATKLNMDGVNIEQAQVRLIVESALADHPEIVPVTTYEGADLFDWTLLWMVTADITAKIAELLGHGGDEDWYFDGLPKTRKLVTRSRISTVKHMRSGFQRATGHDESLGILLNSFVSDESGAQTKARLFARGKGLQPV